MRILSYNIKDGGLEASGDRFAALCSVIRASAADVVCLVEACGLQAVGSRERSSQRFHELSRSLRMSGLVLPAPSSYHVALFHKHTLEVESAEPVRGDFHHGALGVTMQFGSDKPLLVVTTHLHPFSSVARASEAQCLAWYASHHEPTSHVVLAGDLNSTSAQDLESGFGPGPEPARWPVRLLDARGGPDTAPVAILERAGLVDCFRRLHPEEPGATDPTPAFARPGERGARLDFILAGASAAARLRTCEVFGVSAATSASDHFPVLADLEL